MEKLDFVFLPSCPRVLGLTGVVACAFLVSGESLVLGEASSELLPAGLCLLSVVFLSSEHETELMPVITMQDSGSMIVLVLKIWMGCFRMSLNFLKFVRSIDVMCCVVDCEESGEHGFDLGEGDLVRAV